MASSMRTFLCGIAAMKSIGSNQCERFNHKLQHQLFPFKLKVIEFHVDTVIVTTLITLWNGSFKLLKAFSTRLDKMGVDLFGKTF